VTDDLSSGSQDPASPASPEAPESPILTDAELTRRLAMIHAAIDEYEMRAIEERAMKKRAEERDRQA
jgi:hypothetical protein